MERVRAARLVARVAAVALAVPLAVAIPVSPVSSASAAGGAGTALAADTTITIRGRGFGHGRGMGQWGSLGYAVDRGWSHSQVLAHFYGGTSVGSAGDLPISVELLDRRDRGLIATAPGLTLAGVPTGSGAVLLERSGPSGFTWRSGPGCQGPWTTRGRVPSGTVVASAAAAVEVCETSLIRGYRGDLQVLDRGTGSVAVNRVRSETYLRGVVPRESPASWADLGSGRGAEALQAQAVAARSYMLSATYSSYATTCDTTACQVYSGAWTRPFTSATRTPMDDPRTDAAIRATAGEVRRLPSGAVARTEFSSSTGGWTAGGQFPPVPDEGDAVQGNRNHTWTVEMSWGDVEAGLGVGALRGLSVSRRNGLGADGGRVLEVRADTDTGPVTLTGTVVRARLGLRSDWFTLSTTSAADASALVRAIWPDLLGRAPSAAELAERSAEVAAGRPVSAVATDVAASAERAGHLVDETFRAGLDRLPSASERAGWSRVFQREGLVALRVGVLGSRESYARSGSSPRAWADRLYRAVLRRPASAAERDGIASAVAARGTATVTREVATSREAGIRRLEVYYPVMLGRAPDASADGWLPALRSYGDVTVPAGIAGSLEYLLRARSRG